MNVQLISQSVPYDYIKSIPDELIFESFLGIKVDFKLKFTNPFRVDKTPGCFYKFYKNKLYFIDNAWDTNKFAFSAYDLVKKIYNVEVFDDVKRIIYNKLKGFITEPLTKTTSMFRKVESKRLYGAYKAFTEKELEYWKQFNISKATLDLFRVFSVSYVSVNTDFYFESKEDNPAFCYELGPAKYKIYRPYEEKSKKWICNTGKDVYPQGWMNLPREGKSIIITKSMKDVMCLYELGYNAISVHSENIHLKEDIIQDLRSRFATIYILLDNDACGIEHSNWYVKQYGFLQIFTSEKDPSDQIKNKGVQSLIDILDTHNITK